MNRFRMCNFFYDSAGNDLYFLNVAWMNRFRMCNFFYDSAGNALYFLNVAGVFSATGPFTTECIDISNNFFVDEDCYAKNPRDYKNKALELKDELNDLLPELIQCDEVIWDNICPKTGEKSHRVRMHELRKCEPITPTDYKPYLLASILGCVDCMRKYKNTYIHALGLNNSNAYASTLNVECMKQARDDGVDVHSTIARKRMLSGVELIFSNAYMRACIAGDLERMQQAFEDGINIRYCDNTTSGIDGLELAKSSENKLAVELAKEHLKLTEEKE